VICPSVVDEKQEAQLMLTTGSTRLAVNQGQQTEPFHMLHIVSYCAIITCLQDAPFLRYSTSKNVVTLKWGQRSLKVIESGIIR